jgi:hypothetical protein
VTLREIIERLEAIHAQACGYCDDCDARWESLAADDIERLRLDLEIAERRQRESHE